jgi:hypothetical protein
MSSSLGLPLLSSNTAPGNYLTETDSSGSSQNISGNVVANVFYSSQGPLLPTYCSSPTNFINLYGNPDPAVNIAAYCVLTYLNAGYSAIVKRVVNVDASYSWGQFSDLQTLITPPVLPPVPASYGIVIPYESFTPPVFSNYTTDTYIIISTAASVSFNIEINGVNYQVGPIAPVNGESTISALQIVQAINQIAYFTSSSITNEGMGVAFVQNMEINNVLTEVAVFVTPQGVTTTINTISGIEFYYNVNSFNSSNALTSNPILNNYLFQVFGSNPSTYFNNVSVGIGNVNAGVPQQYSITFSTVPTNSDLFNISFYLNGTYYSASNQSNVATALAALLPKITSTGPIPPGYPDDYIFGTHTVGEWIINGSQFANPGEITFQFGPAIFPSVVNGGPITNLIITSTTYAGQISITEIVTQIDSTYDFDLNVYLNNNTNSAIETFRVSLNQQVDSNGNQQFIEAVINNTFTGSKYINVANNPTNPISANAFMQYYYTKIYNNANPFPYVLNLNGGSNGSLPPNSLIANGWSDFNDPEKVSVNILISGGYSSVVVLQAIDAVANLRMDCESILDMPSIYQTNGSTAAAFRQNNLNLSSSRSTLYTPDLQINDPYTGQLIYIPPSGQMAALWSNVDNAVGKFQAAAGQTYGTINGITGLRYLYDKNDRGLLNSVGVNVIKRTRQGTYAVYGAKTLLATPSLLQFIPVRRIFTYCEQVLLNYMNQIDFLNITPQLETTVAQSLKNFLKYMKSTNAIADYSVNTTSVNGGQYTNSGQFNAQIIIYPFVPTQYALLNAVLTNTSATFTESTVGNI